MSRLAIVTGASSGIGAALMQTAPSDVTSLIGVSRRPPPVGAHHAADLAAPSSWRPLSEAIEQALAPRPDAALLLHFAGTMEPTGRADALDGAEVAAALTLNAVAGPVLGGGFLAACAAAQVPATLVLCSSPAASAARPGAAHYAAGKAALEAWARAVAEEQRDAARVLVVVPWGVDTPMVRGAMDAGPDVPLAAVFRTQAARGALADPHDTAREIWALVDTATAETVTAVGAVPRAT